jgi:hypothetical protein
MRRALISLVELALPFIVAAAAWQAFSLLGPFPQRLFPGIETIVATFVRLTASGILPIHALHTVLRLALAFLLATVIGVGLGIVIGRYRRVEDLLLPLVSIGNPIPGLAYAPLGRGFLSGKIRNADNLVAGDRRQQHPRFQVGNLSRNIELLKPLEEIAAAKGCTPAQIALAWVLAQGEDIAAIPGTKRRAYLEENVCAVDIKLDPSELKKLNAVFVPGSTAGTRYPARPMGNMGR